MNDITIARNREARDSNVLGFSLLLVLSELSEDLVTLVRAFTMTK